MPVSVQEAVRRLQDAGITRGDRYQMGTAGKGAAWEGSKARAKVNFAPAMQEALSKDAYGKGLDKAGASSYDSGVRNKGVANWGVGMQAGGEKYLKNIQPFVTLWGEALPTTAGPRRSAQNLKRMTENVQRFIAKKA